jgi:hypothetical protein
MIDRKRALERVRVRAAASAKSGRAAKWGAGADPGSSPSCIKPVFAIPRGVRAIFMMALLCVLLRGWTFESAHPASSSTSPAHATTPSPPAIGGPALGMSGKPGVLPPGAVFGREALRDMARRVARRHGVDEQLVLAVIESESSFDPFAVSPKGAKGLMQLMPETAAYLGVEDPFDPAQSVDGGVRYLKELLDRYDGEVHAALAAYRGERSPARSVPPESASPTPDSRARVTLEKAQECRTP